MTNQRKVIMEELCSVTTHPTAQDLYDMVRKRIPDISLGTVYRNLDTLSNSGLVLKFEKAGQRRFDGDMSAHHHIRCIKCGCIDDVPDRIIRNMTLPGYTKKMSNYKVLGYRLDFTGI